MGSVFTGPALPAGGDDQEQGRRKGKAGGLPQNVVIGVTTDKVFVFGYKPKGTSLKLKDPIGVFERSAMRAEVVGQGTLATRVRFHLPDGRHHRAGLEPDAGQHVGLQRPRGPGPRRRLGHAEVEQGPRAGPLRRQGQRRPVGWGVARRSRPSAHVVSGGPNSAYGARGEDVLGVGLVEVHLAGQHDLVVAVHPHVDVHRPPRYQPG